MRNMFLTLITALLLMSCSHKEAPDSKTSVRKKAIKVETQIAKETEPADALDYTGAIMPAVTIPLSFKTVGTIITIIVDEGDHVKKGQLLAGIDKTTYESSYNASAAMLNQAEDAYNRLKTVYDKGSLPEIQWEDIKTQLQQATTAEEIAKRNLENCELRAPSAGVIGGREIEVGQNATPGLPVFYLMEIGDVFVKIAVPENEISKIRTGQKADVIVGAIGEEAFEAVVEKIGVSANMISKTYEVKLRMKNTGLTVKPGMVCDVKLNIGAQEEVVAIPFQAVLKEDDKNIVYVVNKQQKIVEKKEVKTGNFINNDIEIVLGLSAGDEVVVNGQHKLEDNSQVEV